MSIGNNDIAVSNSNSCITGQDILNTGYDVSEYRSRLAAVFEGVTYAVTSATGIVYGESQSVDSAEVTVSEGIYVIRLPKRSIKVVVR